MVSARGRPAPVRENVERAVRALRHRGPDGDGYYADGPALFGHTRLSIIDLEGGDQPIASEDGAVVTVYNGEIWNYLALRTELERAGHTFRTRADTEVLVHGWEEWGEGLLERLDGMFAFALWDSESGRLLLARDRIGKKPLYVGETGGGLAFGSDARSVLLVAGLEPELATEHVPELLFGRPEPYSAACAASSRARTSSTTARARSSARTGASRRAESHRSIRVSFGRSFATQRPGAS
jgi:asparagine synthase (glutamine-hydrolysing)